ncbi:acyltransferase family protein [Pseudomonas koreensis]|uniref:acyltransferase family protein n=1 Tax=Pseudomonas koreensis TaxID=198620 RepID=UPI001B33D0F1|nr:acyltransferase [Pseudomonas koreensis]
MPPYLSLQAVRGLAALIIVASHVASISAQHMNASPVVMEMAHLGELGWALLFVLSGFSLVLSEHCQFGAKGQAWTFLKRRFFRIYPLYWAYFVVVVVLLRLEPGPTHRAPGDGVDLIASFLLLPYAPAPMFKLAWTLTQLLWCYLVLAAFLRLHLKSLVVALSCWAALMFYALAWLPAPHNPYWRVMVHASSLEFIFGALAGVVYLTLSKRSPGRVMAEPFVLMLGVGSIVYTLPLGSVGNAGVADFMPWPRAVGIGAGTALLLLFLALQETRRKVKVPVVLKGIGDLSYSLLLSYTLTFGLCSQIGQAWLSGQVSVWQVGLVGLLSFILALIVAFLCHWLVEKPLSRYCSRFLGASASPMSRR